MEFSTILKPGAVRAAVSLSSKKRLFMDLGALAAQIYHLDAEAVTEAMLERESLGPTAVGHGVALPHARVAKLDQVVGLFMRLEKPIEFSAADRQPVDLVFGLLAPTRAGVEHLKALALVSRTLRDGDVCTKLRANDDPATLHAILCESRSRQAA